MMMMMMMTTTMQMRPRCTKTPNLDVDRCPPITQTTTFRRLNELKMNLAAGDAQQQGPSYPFAKSIAKTPLSDLQQESTDDTSSDDDSDEEYKPILPTNCPKRCRILISSDRFRRSLTRLLRLTF